MDDGLDNIIYSKGVLEFVTVANEYCAFIDKIDKFTKKDFIDKSQKILTLLYLKSSILPSLESILDSEVERFVTQDDWTGIHDSVKSKLGESEKFIEVKDSGLLEEADLTSVSLSEIFADIFQDMMDFVTLYRIGTEDVMNDALFVCTQNFENYWGQRLLGLLAELHALLYGSELLEEDDY